MAAASRETYTVQNDGSASYQEIQTGAIQRIADATEAMAKHHVRLMEERDRFERYYRDESASHAATVRSLNAMKGVATRQRAEIARLRAALAAKESR